MMKQYSMKSLILSIFALSMGVNAAHASNAWRSPASDVTKSLKHKLALKKQKQDKYAKRHNQEVLNSNQPAQKDLTFSSHHTVESESEGVTKRVGDADFEKSVN